MTCTIVLQHPDDLDEFRASARRLMAAGIPPGDVAWGDQDTGTLFADPLPDGEKVIFAPRSFVDLAGAVVCHRDPQRWPLLYQALWRISRGESALMQQHTDPLVHRLRRMAAAVRHDQHRMTAFLRFRLVRDPDGEVYVAWYEPQHHILRRTASFFVDRFASMRFSILTPDLTLCWDRTAARYTRGLRKQDAPREDAMEQWWQRYYAAIFNPARVNMQLTQRHMPKSFWQNLPEAQAIPDLVQQANARTDRMIGPGGDTGSPQPGAVSARPLFAENA